jgi:hypothetical protein
MSKFKFGSAYKNIVEQHKKDSEEAEKAAEISRDEMTKAIVNMGSQNEGGAGTGVMVRTEAYNKWLVEQQKRNPFIGKSYMQLADEYSRDSEEVTEETAMTDEDAANVLDIDEDGSLHIKDDYDPNNAETVDNEKLVGDAAKFSDLCIINNVISKQIAWDFDSLMDEVTASLKEAHADDFDFDLPENLEEQVDAALKRHDAMMLLTHDKKTP